MKPARFPRLGAPASARDVRQARRYSKIMTSDRSPSLLIAAAVASLSAVTIAACGGTGSQSASSSAPPTTPSGQAATLGVANNNNLGKILDDQQGHTVYLFQKDSGTTSACTGACAGAWPPVRAHGKPTAGTGVTGSLLGTTSRSDGEPQVTYNGHPVYTFTGDKSPGDANGQGTTAFGGGWFALSPAGGQISAPAPGGGSGY
jgi:predicted lipoprotein with Yx(FWY)xxD motif